MVGKFFRKGNIKGLHEPENALSIYPREMKGSVSTLTCTWRRTWLVHKNFTCYYPKLEITQVNEFKQCGIHRGGRASPLQQSQNQWGLLKPLFIPTLLFLLFLNRTGFLLTCHLYVTWQISTMMLILITNTCVAY